MRHVLHYNSTSGERTRSPDIGDRNGQDAENRAQLDRHKEKPMSNMTRQPHTNASPDREREHARHVGTFADGQRAQRLTVVYSDEVGSFGDSERK
jgi:hypothetical protein